MKRYLFNLTSTLILVGVVAVVTLPLLTFILVTALLGHDSRKTIERLEKLLGV